MNYSEALKWIRHLRGVDTPCGKCRGMGRRAYSSGSTWRGGMGTAAFTYDVCDECWGSGDADRHGANLRDLERKRREWEEEQCLSYLADRIGVKLGDVRQRLQDLSELAMKQARRRKLPGGVEPFWWAHSWETLGSILKKLAEGGSNV